MPRLFWNPPTQDPFQGEQGFVNGLAPFTSAIDGKYWAVGYAPPDVLNVAESDDGKLWVPVVEGLFTGNVGSAAAAAGKGSELFIVVGESRPFSFYGPPTAWYSSDGGYGYNNAITDPFAPSVSFFNQNGFATGVTFSDLGPTWVVASGYQPNPTLVETLHTVAYSTDGGANYSHPIVDPTYPYLDGVGQAVYQTLPPLGSRIHWGGSTSTTGGFCLAYSDDGGQTWGHPTSDPFGSAIGGGQVFTICQRGPLLYAGGLVNDYTNGGTVAVSADNGATWAWVVTNPFPPDAAITESGLCRAMAVSGHTIVAAGRTYEPDHSSIQTVLTSDDGGNSWQGPLNDLLVGSDVTGNESSVSALLAVGNLVIAGGNLIGPNIGDGSPWWTLAWATTGIPPTRQYPREDNLGLGAARQRVGRAQPKSLQNSYRQGANVTYS